MPGDLEPDRQHLHPQALRPAAAQGQEGKGKGKGKAMGKGMGEAEHAVHEGRAKTEIESLRRANGLQHRTGANHA